MQATQALSFMDHALLASIKEDQLVTSELEKEAPDLGVISSHRSDSRRVLAAASRALEHALPLIARSSANLQLAKRAACIATKKPTNKLTAGVLDALNRAPLQHRKLFAGWSRPAKEEAEKYLKQTAPIVPEAARHFTIPKHKNKDIKVTVQGSRSSTAKPSSQKSSEKAPEKRTTFRGGRGRGRGRGGKKKN